MSILSLEHSRAKVDYSGHYVPGEPDLPFADKIAAVAAYHRSAATDFDGWLAVQIDRLAGMARCLDATSPDDFDDRHAAMLADVYGRRGR